MLMTPEELKRRLEAGEDPLDLSIEKWKRVIPNIHDKKTIRRRGQIDLYGDTCGLCIVYFSKSDTDYICCAGCPMLRIGRGHCCDVSSLWRDAVRASSSGDLLVAAQAMLEALKKCKTLQEVKQWAHTSSGK